eukprot:scaffold7328_cov314-Pinguiococcus_pyrenoidosus.AAC.30
MQRLLDGVLRKVPTFDSSQRAAGSAHSALRSTHLYTMTRRPQDAVLRPYAELEAPTRLQGLRVALGVLR